MRLLQKTIDFGYGYKALAKKALALMQQKKNALNMDIWSLSHQSALTVMPTWNKYVMVRPADPNGICYCGIISIFLFCIF